MTNPPTSDYNKKANEYLSTAPKAVQDIVRLVMKDKDIIDKGDIKRIIQNYVQQNLLGKEE